MPDPGIFDHILLSFTEVLNLGWTGLTPSALWLAGYVSTWFLIASIPFAMAGIVTVLPRMMVVVVKIMLLFWAILHLQRTTTLLATWLVSVGLFIGRSEMTVAEFMSPGTVLWHGFNSIGPMYAYAENLSSSWWSALTNLVAILLYEHFVLLPMVICFFIMAAHIAVAVIEFQMVAIFSLTMLPWALFSPTRFLASGALNGIIASAVRLATLAFVTGLLLPWITRIAIPPNGEAPVWHALSASAAVGLLMLISWKAPNYAASFMGGGAAFTGSSLISMGLGAAVGGARGIRAGVRAIQRM